MGNGIWLIIVSITTVGYGDFSPKTIYGKIIITFCIFLAIFLTSLTIISVKNSVNLNQNQKKAYSYLMGIQLNNLLRSYSKMFICVELKIYIHKKKKKKPEDLHCLLRKRTLYLRHIFKIKKEISNDNLNSFDEKFIDFAMKLSFEIKNVKHNLKLLEEMKSNFLMQLEEQKTFFQKLESSYINLKFYVKPSIKSFLSKKILIEEGNNRYGFFTDSEIEAILFRNKTHYHDKFSSVANRFNSSNKLDHKKDEYRFNLTYLNKEMDDQKTDRSSKNLIEPNILNEFVLKENFEWNNNYSKNIVREKSKRTYDMINCLQQISNKNLQVSQNNFLSGNDNKF